MPPKHSTISRQALQLTGLIMAHGLAAGGHAQSGGTPQATSGATTNNPTKLPTVVVKGQQETQPELSSPKFTEPLRDIPQSITIIPSALIEQQGATTLRDVLRNVPGISIQAGEGGVPAGDNLSIRGFSARTDMFVDGVRDFGGYSRDPFNIEQVEVIKGPASSFAGRGSTGGAINLSSKAPRLEPSYGGSLGLGTDEYKRTTLDFNQPLDGIGIKGAAVRLNGMWTDAEVSGRDAVENERWGIAPAVGFGLNTATRLTLSFSHLAQDNLPDYGIPWVPANTNAVLGAYSDQAPPVDFNNFYGIRSRDFEETVTDIATAKAEHDFSDSLRLRNLTRFGRTDRDSVITAPRFVNANTTPNAINRQLQSRDMEDTILANQTDMTFELPTGPVDHTLVAGLEYAHETSENFARVQSPLTATPLADLFDPNPDDPFSGTIVRTGAVNKSASDNVALSAFDTLKFGEKWQLTGGLRWENFDLDYESTAANGEVTEFDSTDKMLSWRAGAVFKPRKNGSIYAACGTSFNPSAEGLTLTAATAPLEPEESRSYEIGTKWDFYDSRLALSAALFRTEKTNARTPGLNAGDPPAVLDGDQHVDGVEVGISGGITKDWRVFGGYTYMRSEIDSSNVPAEVGRAFGNTPEHSFSLWTTYQLPWEIEAGAGVQYVGDRFNSNTNTRQAPSYALLDAMLGYNVSKHLTLRLNVYNIADEEYIDRVGGGHFVPGAGRSAMLTASFKL